MMPKMILMKNAKTGGKIERIVNGVPAVQTGLNNPQAISSITRKGFREESTREDREDRERRSCGVAS